jgi:hypothetical protein
MASNGGEEEEDKNMWQHLVPYEITSPEFLERLKADDVNQGGTVNLHCQVIGIPIPTIQWFREDETEISQTDRFEMKYDLETGMANLKIKNVMIFDEMTYKCLATNKHGTAKTIANLVVKAIKSPKSPVSTKNISVTRRSASPLRNIEVPPSNLTSVTEETEHSGSQSEAENLKKKSNTETATDPKQQHDCKILTQMPEKIEIKEGEDLKICCNVLGNLDPLIYN